MKSIIGYTAPDGSSISTHDYQFLSPSQQAQCTPVYGLEKIFVDGDFNNHYTRIYKKDHYRTKKP